MIRRLLELLAVAVVAAFFLAAFWGSRPEATPLRQLVVERGEEDIGASNLVTSIYLGYRAFDTLGESVVLLQAVSGVIVLVTSKSPEDKES